MSPAEGEARRYYARRRLHKQAWCDAVRSLLATAPPEVVATLLNVDGCGLVRLRRSGG